MLHVIETDRIILREFNDADTAAVYEFGSDPEVNKYTGEPALKSLQEAQEIITNINKVDYSKHGYGRWAVLYKPHNKVIGFAGLKYLPEEDETDIGFRFLSQYWGKGIATEVSLEIIKYGFEQLNLKKIIGIAMPQNIASNKVLQKVGLSLFKIDGYLNDGGQYNWYMITKEQFEEY